LQVVPVLLPLESLNTSNTWRLSDDTLFSSKGQQIYAGQKLKTGKGSREEGCYKSLSFKSAAALPLLLFRNSETKNNQEYQIDPSARDADKVKDALSPGQILIVKKIRSKGEGRNWHYYQVFLSDGAFNYKCNINYALDTKELVLPE